MDVMYQVLQVYTNFSFSLIDNFLSRSVGQALGGLRFHSDNDNEYENDNEISLSFPLRFCT